MASFALYRALEGLAGTLSRAGSPVRASLRPGLADDEVRRVFRSVDLVAPYQLVDLYAWADGQWGRYPEGPELLAAAHFPPLTTAAGHYRSLRALAPRSRPDRPRELFPVFRAGADLCVQCGLGAGRGTVWWAPREAGGGAPVPLFDCLADAVEATRWCLESGAWEAGGDGRITRADPGP